MKKSDADILAIDPKKAKQSLTAAVENARAKAGNGPTANAPATPVSEQASLNTNQGNSDRFENNLTKDGSDTPSVKGLENRPSKASQPAAGQQNSSSRADAQKLSPSVSSANPENGSAESSAARKSDGSLALESNRIARGIDLKPQAPRVVSQRTTANPVHSSLAGTGLNGASSVTTQVENLSSSRGTGQNFDSKGKGELIVKPIANSAKGEASQGFQLNEAESSSSRKSSFVAKAQPSSYASKTAGETKEIYTALAKSVDKLVSTKSDSVSIKINFDHGGSLVLRVSMESGQVNTAMQTDVSGLESLIKSSWAEFANELGQKGIKANIPQFNALDSEHASHFEQRGGQSKDGSANDSKVSDQRREQRNSKRASEQETEQAASDSNDSDLSSDQELKTYA